MLTLPGVTPKDEDEGKCGGIRAKERNKVIGQGSLSIWRSPG